MTAAGLLIFDGDCGFCAKTARWYAARAADGASVAASSTLDLDSIGLSEDDVATSVWFRHEDGRLSAGATACADALSALPTPWPLMGRLIAAPGVNRIADIVYAFVARNRHRLPGGTDACRLDTPTPN